MPKYSGPHRHTHRRAQCTMYEACGLLSDTGANGIFLELASSVCAVHKPIILVYIYAENSIRFKSHGQKNYFMHEIAIITCSNGNQSHSPSS